MNKTSRMNNKSFALTMLFVLPAFVLGRAVGNSDEFINVLAQFITLTLLVFLIIWTIRRLRNSGRSAWWTLALLPPATIFLLAYCLFAPSSKEHTDKSLYPYGIRAKGVWRIISIVLISIFLLYLSALYFTFLSDGL